MKKNTQGNFNSKISDLFLCQKEIQKLKQKVISLIKTPYNDTLHLNYTITTKLNNNVKSITINKSKF